MASILRRENVSQGLQEALNVEEDQEDKFLADDVDAFESRTASLTLDLGEPENDINPGNSDSRASIPFSQYNGGTGLISFEIISADKVKDGRSSYVLYTVQVSRLSSREMTPGIIERRYSDFEKLNSKLRKHFPETMCDVSFPGKLLVGNFKDETIAKRSRAFEQYLNHLFSLDRIRFSSEFKSFFYQEEIKEAYERLGKEEFTHATYLFEKFLPVQEKLQGDWHSDVTCTLSALSVCYQKLDQRENALKYAELALSCLDSDYSQTLYLPLLQQCIYLHWMVGKDKTHLESELAKLKRKGIKTEGDIDLKAIVLSQAKSICQL